MPEAESLFHEILNSVPNQFDSQYLLGEIELRRRNYLLAIGFIERALKLDRKCTPAYTSLANALCALNRHEEAIIIYDRALGLDPSDAILFYNCGNALWEVGRYPEARASYDRAMAINPGFAQAHFARCMAELQIVYDSEVEIAERRIAYEVRLGDLCRKGSAVAAGAGSAQPFYLAYQGQNDRDLQTLYGSFLCQLMRERHPTMRLAPPPGPRELLRIGIVSGFFRNHANWRLPIKGWLHQLDRRKFRLFGYYTGTSEDGETSAARAMCERFVKGPRSIEDWRAEILADAPHVLIYPEIGMDRTVTALAAQRLATVQCNSWASGDQRLSHHRLFSQQRVDGAGRRTKPLYRKACSPTQSFRVSRVYRIAVGFARA